ncbi:hypothetical protein TNCV_939701 [Trichonephila clavipes]|nr:hypothetical protein TNCV_939701 [Trichonephila clavipes]
MDQLRQFDGVANLSSASLLLQRLDCPCGDGTGKTRGYSSRVGMCAVIVDKTGKCIDTEVMSSFCKVCDSWKQRKESPA